MSDRITRPLLVARSGRASVCHPWLTTGKGFINRARMLTPCRLDYLAPPLPGSDERLPDLLTHRKGA